MAMRRVFGAIVTMILLGTTVIPPGRAAVAVTLPSGFQEQIVFTGLNNPVNLEFSPDGRVFVAEKAGVIKVFDSIADPTPTVFADLSANVFGSYDRGLLGMALAPAFPDDPYVYVLYAYDAPPGQVAPYYHDDCNNLPGGYNGGNCVVTSRVSRLQADGDTMTGSEHVLIQGEWCQQFPSHSSGDVKFGADGMLYVTGGDGANFNDVDYGQFGSPPNPCGDPGNEGGGLRAQDVRTDGDPAGSNGAVLRVDPATGAAAPGNPFSASADPKKRRVVAYGLRNPYKFTMRPGTSEAWIGDVGWGTWEEIDRLTDPLAAGGTNFGWPCYEGNAKQPNYDNLNLPLCESLYPAGGDEATPPYFTYHHGLSVTAGDNCVWGGSAIAGMAFYPTVGGSYPADYAGGLFFADYGRDCLWVMKTPPGGGLPSTSRIEAFAGLVATPVDVAVGPGGEVYYADLGGTIRRIRYFPNDEPPVADIDAVPISGQAPLAVHFDAGNSYDPDPADEGRLTYEWDFTNDGTFDATGVTADFTFPNISAYEVRLRVTDTLGVYAETTLTIHTNGFPPTAIIDSPGTQLTWAVGDQIAFSGHATDPESGTLPAAALTWELRLQHCVTINQCHTHIVQTFSGVSGGSFAAPDHEYPAYLELALTATDPEGQSSTVVRRLNPKTHTIAFNSRPSGITITVGSYTGATPFSLDVIEGSTRTLSAPLLPTLDGKQYSFLSWSDHGAATHVAVLSQTTSYRANYFRCGGWYLFLRPVPCQLAPMVPRKSMRVFA
jgi:glucose/arabinose dehydrogenase